MSLVVDLVQQVPRPYSAVIEALVDSRDILATPSGAVVIEALGHCRIRQSLQPVSKQRVRAQSGCASNARSLTLQSLLSAGRDQSAPFCLVNATIFVLVHLSQRFGRSIAEDLIIRD